VLLFWRVLALGLVSQSGSAAAAAPLQRYTYLSGDAAAATPLQYFILFVLPGNKLQCSDEGVSFPKHWGLFPSNAVLPSAVRLHWAQHA
jgi:hypothetical protein